MRGFDILGTRVQAATYDSGLEEVLRLAESGKPAAVSAANTHIIALARQDPSFGEVMRRFSLVLPDGVPLVWQLNRKGAGLTDRVYGPYFMRHVLAATPAPRRHFFFGGSEDCLARLTEAAKTLQPGIQIVGTISPPFRTWTEDEEAGFARQIRDSGADFIWVALGGERQERWIAKNLHRYQRGVFFAVGDAFELLAGSRPFAPEWMQKRGLTWLYRLVQEPRRLWPRYLKFNSLFLWFLWHDGLPGLRPLDRRRLRVAFLGSRGVPARYSGFEVVVEELGSRLVSGGHEVTVYNRYPRFAIGERTWKGMRLITLPTIPTKSLDTIVHTSLSVADALLRRYDLIYLCGVGNSLLAWPLRWAGLRVIINVDGADFRRAKWGTLGRQWLKMSEYWATQLAHRLIADNREIVRRYEQSYGVVPDYISYGCQLRPGRLRRGELERWGLTPDGYVLHVSRLTPDNEADLLLQAWQSYRGTLRLVITGAEHYEHAYYRRLQSLADERVLFTGARYDEAYLELSQNALFFVMPAAIEATRLVLLDQMAMGKTVLFKDSPATREVVGEAAVPFAPDGGAAALAEKLGFLASHPALCAELGGQAFERARREFSWDAVVAKYESLFDDLFPCPRSRSSPPR